MMIGTVARLGACRRGVSAVEMALVMPLFFALLLGVVNVSLVLWTQASLYFAAQAAARCASANPTICGKPADQTRVEDFAMSQYFGQSLPDAPRLFTYNLVQPGCGHRVEARYAYPLSLPFYDPPPRLSLSASACFPAGGSSG